MGGRLARKAGSKSSPFVFHIYVAGQTSRSLKALARLRDLCRERYPGQYEMKVIDVASRPNLAKAHQLLTMPTVLRTLPRQVQRVIGGLSDAEKALLALDLLKIAELDILKRQAV